MPIIITVSLISAVIVVLLFMLGLLAISHYFVTEEEEEELVNDPSTEANFVSFVVAMQAQRRSIRKKQFLMALCFRREIIELWVEKSLSNWAEKFSSLDRGSLVITEGNQSDLAKKVVKAFYYHFSDELREVRDALRS